MSAGEQLAIVNERLTALEGALERLVGTDLSAQTPRGDSFGVPNTLYINPSGAVVTPSVGFGAPGETQEGAQGGEYMPSPTEAAIVNASVVLEPNLGGVSFSILVGDVRLGGDPAFSMVGLATPKLVVPVCFPVAAGGIWTINAVEGKIEVILYNYTFFS